CSSKPPVAPSTTSTPRLTGVPCSTSAPACGTTRRMGTSEELEARTPDGVVLRLDRVKPSGARTGVVVCLHAMMTDGRYFGARRPSGDGFAHALAAVGLDVFVADFRGHGGSVPPVAGKHDWSFDDLVEHDLPTI